MPSSAPVLAAEPRESRYIGRALAAYFGRSTGGRDAPLTPVSPAPMTTRIVELSGLRYVGMWAQDGHVLAVYRITTTGELRRLRRWPRELEEEGR